MTTFTDRSAAPDSEFAAVLAAIEAAPEAEESLRERVARAIFDADHVGGDPWESSEVSEWERDFARTLADAALAVMRGEQP